jgi:fermentation-respiration switch protein FrsA (DUF1100 family)
MKRIVWTVIISLAVMLAILTGAGFYMMDYSLSPDPTRENADSCYRQLYEHYPETAEWTDSLQRIGALRDTFLTMASGERHHAYYVDKGCRRTAFVLHGWRGQAIKFFYLGRMYERTLGYNIVIPDLHASGKSEGEAISMGWQDRKDVMEWMQTFKTDTMVVHGVSMGAATAMMLSAMQMPDGVKDIRFIEDCGYTSVWDEFEGQLKEQFDLPAFPLLYTTSLLCRLRYGWSFGEASSLNEVAKCPYPMLFIHGDKDTFVPTEMVYRLYAAKPEPKTLWIAPGADHARSYMMYPAEYISRVRDFLADNH